MVIASLRADTALKASQGQTHVNNDSLFHDPLKPLQVMALHTLFSLHANMNKTQLS